MAGCSGSNLFPPSSPTSPSSPHPSLHGLSFPSPPHFSLSTSAEFFCHFPGCEVATHPYNAGMIWQKSTKSNCCCSITGTKTSKPRIKPHHRTARSRNVHKYIDNSHTHTHTKAQTQTHTHKSTNTHTDTMDTFTHTHQSQPSPLLGPPYFQSYWICKKHDRKKDRKMFSWSRAVFLVLEKTLLILFFFLFKSKLSEF